MTYQVYGNGPTNRTRTVGYMQPLQPGRLNTRGRRVSGRRLPDAKERGAWGKGMSGARGPFVAMTMQSFSKRGALIANQSTELQERLATLESLAGVATAWVQ